MRNSFLFFFVLAMPFFEYGSYKYLFVWNILAILGLFLAKKSIKDIVVLGIFCIIGIWLSYNLKSIVNYAQLYSFLVWISGTYIFFKISHKNLRRNLIQRAFRLLAIVAILDWFIFGSMDISLSESLFNIESRHITKSTGLMGLHRSTGFFGEPGTQAVALGFMFYFAEPNRINRIIYIISGMLTFSPYILLPLLLKAKRSYKALLFIVIVLISITPGNRLYDIVHFRDTSFLMRVDSVLLFMENYTRIGYFNDYLFTDVGLWFEMFAQIGHLGILFLLLLLFAPGGALVLLLKIKVFAGYWMYSLYSLIFDEK